MEKPGNQRLPLGEIAVVLLVLPSLAAWMIIGSSVRYPGLTPGVVMAAAMIAAAVFFAVGNAALPAGVRHVYTAHYAIVAGLVSVSWTLPLLRALPPNAFWTEIAAAFILATGPWSITHVLTSMASNVKTALCVAAISAAVFAALLHIHHPLWPIALALVVLIAGFESVPPAGAPMKSSAAKAIFYYILLNAILGGGILAIFIPIFTDLFSIRDIDSLLELANQQLNAGNRAWPSDGIPSWFFLASRWAYGLIGFFAGFGAVYIWPRNSLRPAGVVAASLALLFAARNTGSYDLGHAAIAAVTGISSLIAAAYLARWCPRRERLPLALAGAAIGATILVQAQAIFVGKLLTGFGLWFAEAIVLGGIWITVYFLGVQRIRSR